MSAGLLSLVILAFAIVGFVVGRARAMQKAAGDSRVLHSLPSYYGYSVFLFTAVPALIIVAAWSIFQPMVIDASVIGRIAPSDISDGSSRALVMSDVRRVADGIDQLVASGTLSEQQLSDMRAAQTDVRAVLAGAGIALGADVKPTVFQAAKAYRDNTATGKVILNIVALVAAIVGFGFAMMRIETAFRARNVVERFILVLLIAASSVAVLPTLGIVMSLVFETFHFFAQHLFGVQREVGF